MIDGNIGEEACHSLPVSRSKATQPHFSFVSGFLLIPPRDGHPCLGLWDYGYQGSLATSTPVRQMLMPSVQKKGLQTSGKWGYSPSLSSLLSLPPTAHSLTVGKTNITNLIFFFKNWLLEIIIRKIRPIFFIINETMSFSVTFANLPPRFTNQVVIFFL